MFLLVIPSDFSVEKWCQDYHLNHRALQTADAIRSELTDILKRIESSRIELNCKQSIRRVFRPLDFFHILLLYSLIIKYLINLHTIPHNDKAKTGF